MSNWKTTTAGIATILGALSTGYLAWFHGTAIDWATTATAIVAGIGLIHARDSKKTDLTPNEQVATKQLVTPIANDFK